MEKMMTLQLRERRLTIKEELLCEGQASLSPVFHSGNSQGALNKVWHHISKGRYI
jgi:hypothetical protein